MELEYQDRASLQGRDHTRADATYDCSLKMSIARSVRFFVNLGLGLVFYGLLVKCSAMSLFERS